MDLRARILKAASDLYGETGFRGTTTRQIAQRAGVNEVTLFRQFGTKTALLHEAIKCACGQPQRSSLPERPAACAGRDLAGYVARLRGAGLARAELDTATAAAMLMGCLFADAMSRDIMPLPYRSDPGRAIAGYVDLFLRAIGAPAASGDGRGTAPGRARRARRNLKAMELR